LIAVILVGSIGKTLVVLHYELNKAYITSVFCVNKDKPMKNCNGQCHLKKQLNKTDGNASGQEKPIRTAFRELTFFFEHNDAAEHLFDAACIQYHDVHTDALSDGHLRSSFHPPSVG
jgi:hypothetical protein